MLESEGYFIDEAKASLQDIYQKYYKDIPVNDFNKLVSADPTAKPNEMGKFGKWILNLYRNGKLKVGDTPELDYALSYFVKFYNKIEKKDINQYHSVDELYQVIKPFTEDPNQATSKTDANRKTKEEGAEKFYEDDIWLVIIPKTEEASCLYGKGTKWCTAATEGGNKFNEYNQSGNLYININKKTGKKYQFFFGEKQGSNKTPEYNDEENNPLKMPIAKTIGMSEQLVQLYCKYTNSIYTYFVFETSYYNTHNITARNINNSSYTNLYTILFSDKNDKPQHIKENFSQLVRYTTDPLEYDVLYEGPNIIDNGIFYGKYVAIRDDLGEQLLNLYSLEENSLTFPDDTFKINLLDQNLPDFPYLTFSNPDGKYFFDLEIGYIRKLTNFPNCTCKTVKNYMLSEQKIKVSEEYNDFVYIMNIDDDFHDNIYNIKNDDMVFEELIYTTDKSNKQYPTFFLLDDTKVSLLPDGRTVTLQSESKKILFSSESLMRLNEALNEEKELNKVELPKPLLNQLKKHRTSLGDNPAFPPEDETSFDYKLTLSHFKAISEHLETFDNVEDITNKDSLKTLLSTLVAKAIELEKPIREELERICFNFIIDKFGLPEDTVDFSCELTDTIDVSNKRLTPEETDGTVEFDGIREIKMLSKEVYKRRFINCLVQGASLYYSMQVSEYVQDIYKLNPKLPELYDEIMTLNTYLSFITNDEMDLKNPSSAGDVEVRLGNDVNKTSIESKGVVFPVLLSESIKGFMELFASHGLPDDMEQASYVIKKADFLLAEPWDIRLGVPLWEKFINKIPSEETKLIPYIFSEYVSLPTEKFNETSQEIFENTKTGKEYINMLLKKIQYEIRKDDFDSFISKQSTDDVLISDGEDEYFTIEELIGG